MVGDWSSVRDLCSRAKTNVPPEIILGRVLLSMRDGNAKDVANALQAARAQLAAPIHSVGQSSYRRMYETVLNLHLVRDMEIIYSTIIDSSADSTPKDKLKSVFKTLSRRLDSTLPSFRIREPILSLQRITLGLRFGIFSIPFILFYFTRILVKAIQTRSEGLLDKHGYQQRN